MFEYKVQDSYRIAPSEIISVRGGNSVVVDGDENILQESALECLHFWKYNL